MKKFSFFFILVLSFTKITEAQPHAVNDVKVTILSTMLAQEGIGEWGFSALVEVDSIKILFDAGGRKTTVSENSKELKVDLSKVSTLILSHWHDDHTSGWMPLRNEVKQLQTNALSNTHVAYGFFDIRFPNHSKESKSRRKDSLDYVLTGGKIIQHQGFDEIFPGIYLTGNVPRIFDEKNYYKANKRLDKNNQLQEDNIPDDMSLVISTNKGLILISGCGHSGLVNTIAHINKNLPNKKVIAAIGGFHLLNANDKQLKWTSEQLKKAGIQYFIGAHCTGIEPVYQIRSLTGLQRGNCVVGSVGDRFELNKGVVTGDLNK
jgi:7,8-dihydropterin-6-yl-methyl-4-(beta-D-ribofuranosyl)aminobenzene 5'-phosphate synthase